MRLELTLLRRCAATTCGAALDPNTYFSQQRYVCNNMVDASTPGEALYCVYNPSGPGGVPSCATIGSAGKAPSPTRCAALLCLSSAAGVLYFNCWRI